MFKTINEKPERNSRIRANAVADMLSEHRVTGVEFGRRLALRLSMGGCRLVWQDI